MNRWGSIESIILDSHQLFQCLAAARYANKHAKQNRLDIFVKDLQYRAFLKEKSLLLTLLKVYVSWLSLFVYLYSFVSDHSYNLFFLWKFTSSFKVLLYTYLYSIPGGRPENPVLVLHFGSGSYKKHWVFFYLNSHRVKMLRVIFNKTPFFEELEWMCFVMLKQHGTFQNAVWSFPALPHNAITVKGVRDRNERITTL